MKPSILKFNIVSLPTLRSLGEEGIIVSLPALRSLGEEGNIENFSNILSSPPEHLSSSIDRELRKQR